MDNKKLCKICNQPLTINSNQVFRCKPCRNSYSKNYHSEYRQNNREKYNADSLERNRVWRENNREKAYAAVKRWRADPKNAEKVREYAEKEKMRKRLQASIKRNND